MDLTYYSLLLLSYLSGSISSAILVCRIFTLPDPTITGSNNPGATNVLRIGGKKAAFATLIGDISKTAVPLILGMWLGLSSGQLIWIGAIALVGHCFPVFYQLKGGKGVASYMTLFIIVTPLYGLLVLGCWLITAWTFQRSSIASIIAALILPFFVYQFSPELLLPVSTVSGVVLIRHRRNLENLLKGSEPIIGHSN